MAYGGGSWQADSSGWTRYRNLKTCTKRIFNHKSGANKRVISQMTGVEKKCEPLDYHQWTMSWLVQNTQNRQLLFNGFEYALFIIDVTGWVGLAQVSHSPWFYFQGIPQWNHEISNKLVNLFKS